MQLKKGAEVFAASGEKIGSVDRVVIDPETKEVSHLVVGKGILSTTNIVIPIEYIDQEVGNAEHIALEKNEEDLESLPSYDPDSYLELDKSDYPTGDEYVESVYWYPPVYNSWWTTMGGRSGAYPKPVYVKAESVLPEGAVALKQGAKVVSKDGEHIGNVEEVIVQTAEDVATHIVISKGFFLKERKLVPTTWVADVDENQVTLSVESDMFDRLPAYEAEA